MKREQAQAKVSKLRAHAASVEGTPEAALFYTKANALAHQHGLPATPCSAAETPHPTRARPSATTTQQPTTATARRTTTMTSTTTTTKAKPARPAADTTMRQAFTPRTRAAFTRNSEPGTEISGHIVAIEEEPDLDYHTKAPKLDTDGNPRMVPILIIQTDATSKPHGPGLRKLWVRSGIADALIGACLDTGVQHTTVGGKVRIRYEGLGEPPIPNFSAPKLYTALYEPPIDQQPC